jgi:hypothetical protein
MKRVADRYAAIFFFPSLGRLVCCGLIQGQDQVESPAKPTRGRKRERRGRIRGKDAKKAKNHNRASLDPDFSGPVSETGAQRQNQRMRRCSEPPIERIRHRDFVLAGQKKQKKSPGVERRLPRLIRDNNKQRDRGVLGDEVSKCGWKVVWLEVDYR